MVHELTRHSTPLKCQDEMPRTQIRPHKCHGASSRNRDLHHTYPLTNPEHHRNWDSSAGCESKCNWARHGGSTRNREATPSINGSLPNTRWNLRQAADGLMLAILAMLSRVETKGSDGAPV